jgi:CRP-like cAMP-binding protein
MPINANDLLTLKQSPLFSSLSEAQLERLQPSLSARTLAQGEHLFEEGMAAESFYLLLQGRLKLFRVSAAGNEKVIEIVRQGQAFAEALMFLDRPVYPVAAQTLTEARLVVINNKGFHQLISESTETCFRVMGSLSIRLRQLLNEIDSLTLKNASLRVVSYLLYLVPEGEKGKMDITLPAAKNIIASRLSIQPETLSRILNTLCSRQLIQVEGLNICIHDIEALRAYEG